MKKSVFLLLITSLVLAACQNDKAPAESAAVASVTTDVAKAPVEEMQQADKQAAVSIDSAVAVTKPAESNMAQSLQAALHQAGAGLKVNVDAIKEKSVIADKADVTKQVAVKPSVVKAAVAQKAAKAAEQSHPKPQLLQQK